VPKVLNKYKDAIPSNAVWIMRPGKWGNPFAIGKDGDRAEVIAKYEKWFSANKSMVRDARRELAGRDLVCCCSPQVCHGDVLLRYANPMLKSQREQVLIIDGSCLTHRSYHIAENQDEKYNYHKGVSIGARRILATKLRQLFSGKVNGLTAKKGIFTLEGGDNFRCMVDPKYKASRVRERSEIDDEIELLPEMLDVMGIYVSSCAHFEADDVMATLSRQAIEQGYYPIVVTTDKDMASLVDDDCEVFNPYLENGTFVERSTNAHMLLMGDPVDDIRPVPGFGETRAREAMKNGISSLLEFKGMKPAQLESLANNLPRLFVNQKLVSLRGDVPILVDFTQLPEAFGNHTAVIKYADQHGLRGLSNSTLKDQTKQLFGGKKRSKKVASGMQGMFG